MKTYHFFNLRQAIEIDFDENRTVRELVKAVCEKYALKTKDILDVVTVYDSNNHHVVTDTKRTLKQENLSCGLCFAYFKKGEFLFVEGSWGHHMIKMDAVSKIKNPFDFRMSLSSRKVEFEYFVATSSMKVKTLYDALLKLGYLKGVSQIEVSYSDITNSKFERAMVLPIQEALDKGMTILELIKDYKCPQCMVISFS